MIRPPIVMAIARAESRLNRRLVRYWVFVSLSTLVGVGGLTYYGILHYFFSSYSATVAVLNPRYFMGPASLYYLFFFVFGLVFLGFDVRARDRRDRVMEVVDAMPGSNLELVLGKALGVILPSWIPVVLICVLLFVAGMIAGTPIQPLSLVNFSVSQAIPAFTFMLGLVFFVTLLVRNRLIAAILLVLGLAGVLVGSWFLPLWIMPMTDILGVVHIPFPSDLVPILLDMESLTQRSAVFLAGLGLLGLAAAVHPRLEEGSRTRTVAIGLVFFVLGLALSGSIVLSRLGTIKDAKTWRTAHAALAGAASPDVASLRGDIEIRPGRSLTMNLETRFVAPEDVSLPEALFTLNPGLTIESITDSGGASRSFRHENGLVTVDLDPPLAPGAETTLTWRVAGRPDASFAYFDQEEHPLDIDLADGNIFMLGYDSVLFTRSYVALLPGVRWLPVSGAEVGRGDPNVRPTDFFNVDLTVEVPDGWLVAGPGRRSDEGSNRYRFAPEGPVPGAALVAAPFVSRSTEIEGITAEILLHPKHAEVFEQFEDAAPAVRSWIEDRLAEAAGVGLDYPYDGISMVEAPASLRGYGGGWRRGSVMSPPAMVLVRESGFPTARFDRPFEDTDKLLEHEGGIGGAKVETLERFFENDFGGGNPFTGAGLSFFSHQTSGAGPEGLSMDFVCEDLSTRIVTRKKGFFSAYVFDRGMNDTINKAMINYFVAGDGEGNFTDAIIAAVTSSTEVWDTVIGVALSQLNPWEDSRRAINVLTLKGGAMARSMLDDLGSETTGNLLASLRNRSMGTAYDRADIIEAGNEAGVDLEEWLDVWIDHTDLPGFVASDIRAFRAEDSEDGSPQYQVKFTLRNDEEVPGLLRVEYRTRGEDDQSDRGETDPIRVMGKSAIEVGIVTSKPPQSVRVAPYLSLNRGPFDVSLPAIDEESVEDDEPFRGSREVPWSIVDDGAVVVDDLSPGFSIEEDEGGRSLRLGKQAEAEETDQGLPVREFGRPPAQWSRGSTPTAYGKYRHTYAIVKKGTGATRAVFSADIEDAGLWELEIHVPVSSQSQQRRFYGRDWKTWNLKIVDASGDTAASFDSSAAGSGWNSVGSFEIADGEVRVELHDDTDGSAVIADAIRWVPPAASRNAGSPEPETQVQ